MVMAAAALTGFTACSDDDDVPAAPSSPELQLPEETIRVRIGDEYRVPVDAIPLTGAGEYSAYSLSPEICGVETDEDGTMYVAGYKNGTGSIVLADAAGNYKRIAVAVYTTDVMQLNYPNLKLTTQLGQLNRVNAVTVAAGNGGYSVESKDSRIEATVDYETGAISIVAASEAEPYTGVVTVTDQTGLTADLNVEVSESTDRVKIGVDTKAELPIDPSLGEYTVECLTPQYAEIVTEGNKVYLEGKANGAAYVNIGQGDLLRQITYSVYTTDVLTMNETSFSFETPLGLSSSTNDCYVVLGNGGYTVTSNNAKVTATINSITGVLTITATSAKDPFTAVLTVKDCTGLTATVSVTVSCTFDAFTDSDIAMLAAKTANEVYIKSSQFRETTNTDCTSSWGWSYGEWKDADNGDGTHTFGWWEPAYGDYGGHYITYPEGTGLNAEVDAKYIFQYSRGTTKWTLNGKAKIIRDDNVAKVMIWWYVDLDNETINRGWIVRKK